MSDPIRIFVGCCPNGSDAESLAVLEYTIRKHASEPVALTFMRLSRDMISPFYSDAGRGWRTERWATPFSGLRWSIPAACGFEGRAIYTDSDVIFMADVAELFRQDMGGHAVLAKSSARLCVSLWDNAAAKAHLWPLERLRADPEAHRAMGARFREPAVVGPFAGHWNVLDAEGFADMRDPAIKAHHYTSIDCQVHLKHALPRMEAAGLPHWFDGRMRPHPRQDLQALFDELLAEAEAAGYRRDLYLPDEPYGDVRKASLSNYQTRAHA